MHTPSSPHWAAFKVQLVGQAAAPSLFLHTLPKLLCVQCSQTYLTAKCLHLLLLPKLLAPLSGPSQAQRASCSGSIGHPSPTFPCPLAMYRVRNAQHANGSTPQEFRDNLTQNKGDLEALK